jgi:hypothetical protein
MPVGFASGLHTAFAYLTVEQVRAAGIPDSGDSGIPDERLRPLIREVSHWINRLTDQWFLPIRLRERTDGNNGAVARIPNLIPILELFSLKLEKPGLFSLDLPDVAYMVKQRYVMMLDRHMKLPEQPHFVVLDGVFGWLVDDYVKAKTRTVATLSVTGSDVTAKTKDILVASVDGFNAGDAILVGNDPEPLSYPAIVIGVVPTPPLKVVIEPVVPFSLPSGVLVSRYGRVPDRIQRACLLLVRDKIQKVGDIDTSDSPGGIGTRLNSESVEGYSYSLSPLKAINSPGGGAMTTGNAEVDDILTEFTPDRGGLFIGYA